MECFRDPRNEDSDFGEGIMDSFTEDEINAELSEAASQDRQSQGYVEVPSDPYWDDLLGRY